MFWQFKITADNLSEFSKKRKNRIIQFHILKNSKFTEVDENELLVTRKASEAYLAK